MHTGHNQEVTNELFIASGHETLVGGPVAEEFALSVRKEEREGAERESHLTSVEIEDPSQRLVQGVPDMWSWSYIGLYSQYAAIGLLYGSSGTLLPFCVYNFEGASNVCANAKNIVFFAWSFKIWFAILTDSFRPFGYRRKAWMFMGWCAVLVLLLALAIAAHKMDTSTWLVTLLLTQCFMMLADVPADGYSVELGQMEPKEQRGQILATGQRVRFTFCIVAGVIQTFLLNGPQTNDSDCPVSFQHCWKWGLTINQYYALLFVMVFFLTLPLIWMKELDDSHIPRHTAAHFVDGIWQTLQNLTTFYLLIFVIGVQSLSHFTNNANISLQYYVIKLTNFQAGIDTITTYAALVTAIWLFQKYFINRNWRATQYGSTFIAALLGLMWIAPYYNAGGTMDPWFTIFIDLDTSFAQGLAQVLYSMAVIELARPGQEATTYELIVTVGNAALTASGVISTQLLTPMKAAGCSDDNCSSDTVDVTNKSTFEATNGPERFTKYTLLLTGVSIASSLIFTRFLPASKDECQEWKKRGEEMGASRTRGFLSLAMAAITVMYGLSAAILLLNVDTACEPAVGGSGC